VAAQVPQGLVRRRVADGVAAGVFVVVIILCLWLLKDALPNDSSRKVTTVKTTTEVIEGTKDSNQRKEITETTTADISPSVWERLMGPRIILLVALAIVLLAAFVAAAAARRVLLGHYAFSLGTLTVPEITGADVREAVREALAGMPPPAESTEQTTPEPPWATVDDPRLALAGWRIDLEQTLRDLVERQGIKERHPSGAGQYLRLLRQREILSPDVVPGLEDLLRLANQAVHGAQVDATVVPVLRTEGRRMLEYLRGLPQAASS
jgi:hypothetical protein